MEHKTLTLSEAEVLIIQAERAKAEAAKLEAEAYEAQQVKKAIDDKQKYVSNRLKELNEQYQATKRYYNDLKSETSQVTLIEEERTIEEIPWYYRKTPDSKEPECVNLEPITAVYKEAILKVMEYRIGVERHEIYSSQWSRTPSSNNFEMKIKELYDSRWYKKAKTIITKIIEIKAKKEAKEQKTNARDVAKKNAYNDITQQYPDAEIKLDKDYYKDYKGNYTDWDVLNIKFNGNEVQYRIYATTPTSEDSKTYKLSFTKMIPVNNSIESVMVGFGA